MQNIVEREQQGVTIICLDCDEEKINQLSKLCYDNLKIEQVDMVTEGLHKVFQIILEDTNTYITFAEKNRVSLEQRLDKMVTYLESEKQAQAVLCFQEYVGENNEHVAWSNKLWMEFIKSQNYRIRGNALLELSMKNQENYWGNLECCMFRREAFINKAFLLNSISCETKEQKLLLMCECLYDMNVGVIPETLVRSKEQKLIKDKVIEEYQIYQSLRDKIMRCVYGRQEVPKRELPLVLKRMLDSGFDGRELVLPVKKEITFFYMDRAEFYNLEPIAIEAKKRGYKVEFTQELSKKAEIGIYSSHVGCLVNANFSAKFSVILLHDMTQGELDWPDLWNDEPWYRFDLGILPGEDWANRWRKCSGFEHAHTKLGVYRLGYPQGDLVSDVHKIQYAEELKKSLNLKYPYSILYAPSWENDGKEDDFVKALCDLPVNLIIKQANFDASYGEMIKNIQEMRELHEGKYDNVYYIDTRESIMSVIPFCDILVSEESSVMTEALLYDKPSIAVMDWLIPDVTPHRKAAVPFDYVYKCEKRQLREKVEELMARTMAGEVVSKTTEVFSNIGNCSSDIMDLIEYYIGEREHCEALKAEILPIHQFHGMWD